MPWTECEFNSDNEESRIPYNVLDTSDAETVYKNHVNVLQQEQKRLEYVICFNTFIYLLWLVDSLSSAYFFVS